MFIIRTIRIQFPPFLQLPNIQAFARKKKKVADAKFFFSQLNAKGFVISLNKSQIPDLAGTNLGTNHITFDHRLVNFLFLQFSVLQSVSHFVSYESRTSNVSLVKDLENKPNHQLLSNLKLFVGCGCVLALCKHLGSVVIHIHSGGKLN